MYNTTIVQNNSHPRLMKNIGIQRESGAEGNAGHQSSQFTGRWAHLTKEVPRRDAKVRLEVRESRIKIHKSKNPRKWMNP
jgi:hypothetical protein